MLRTGPRKSKEDEKGDMFVAVGLAGASGVDRWMKIPLLHYYGEFGMKQFQSRICIDMNRLEDGMNRCLPRY